MFVKAFLFLNGDIPLSVFRCFDFDPGLIGLDKLLFLPELL
jgi:hypothetical protein